MNPNALYHLVILIEETTPILSVDIKYCSPFLPVPFSCLKKISESKGISNGPSTSDERPTFSPASITEARGNRNPQSISVTSYNFTDRPCLLVESMDVSKFEAPERIPFYSGNPNVEITEGIIHIYKNKKEVDNTDGGLTPVMLCIFAVPSYISVKDLLVFLAPMRDKIQQLKVVKDGTPNRYMALLKFRSQTETTHFYDTYNNTCYNELESDVCQLMYVSHIDTLNSTNVSIFPTGDLLELPSCPVCLERLDEPVQGILTTILCNHTFHDECISKVAETTCPVCRYVQSPEMVSDSQCADCLLRENLWICLICGRIGCGRYGHKHAQRHFEETGHTFSLELGKNLVWDYADDAYVHRLAVNHEDGKLVQVGSSSETGDKKLDLFSMEFSAILTSQLESQRTYFEAQLDRVVADSTGRLEAIEAKAEEALARAQLAEEKLTEINKEKSSLLRKLNQSTALAQRLQHELEEERALNKSLLTNQETWRIKAEKAEIEAKEAQVECQELLLNLELRTKLSELGAEQQLTAEEMENCELVLQPPAKQTASRRRRKR